MPENAETKETYTKIEDSNEIVEKQSCMESIKEKLNDQDFQQQMSVSITFALELYKVLMGGMLIMFVPQKCGDTSCTITENISRTDDFSMATLAFNIITFLCFFALYIIEVRRENYMINYLEVNRFKPKDNESVGEALQLLPKAKQDTLHAYDRYYYNSGMVSLFVFIINVVLSGYFVSLHYLDGKTISVFLTNVIFMSSKVSEVNELVNTKENVFYSAYLNDRVQYNDVDPDKAMDAPVSDKVEVLEDIKEGAEAEDNQV